MTQAHLKPVWQISRGDERPCLLSDRELLMLAELGHLQANDLLWRPGFEGWRTVRSLMGDLTTPPLPPFILQNDRPKQICAKASSSSWSIHRHSGGVELETFLGRAKQPRNLAGLLAAVILVGALGIAFHKSFATDTQLAIRNSASNEPPPVSIEASQPKPEPTAANGVPPFESNKAELEGGIVVRTVRVLSIDNPEPSDASASVPNPAPEVPSNSVPLPTKKPAIPNQSLNTAGLMRANTVVSQTANADAPVAHDRPSEVTLGFRTMDGP
jgi:hypothetical protein